MYHLHATLETAADNVALDEALLELAEAGELPGETLRLWESRQHAVVLGKSSLASEFHAAACAADAVPVLRRASGGAPVVIGPGCLMYALVLDRRARPELRGIDGAHDLVMSRMAAALGRLVPGVGRLGTCDLVLPDANGRPPRKFSGNSLRVKRDWVLYHGTILYDFALERIERWLATPRRQPEYRAGRGHGAFVTNLPAPRAPIEQAIVEAWEACEPLPCNPPAGSLPLEGRAGEGVEAPSGAANSIAHRVPPAITPPPQGEGNGRIGSMHREPLLTMLERYAARYPAEGAVTARIRTLVSNHADCFERTCRPGHVTASAWVTTPQRDKFLLVHHRKLNRWLQPGGHLDGHGDVAAAALREVQEETGLADVRLEPDGVGSLLRLETLAHCRTRQSQKTPDPLAHAGLTPLDLDVHDIPARYDAAGNLVDDAHEHHDVRLLAIAHGDLTPHVSDESHAVRWFTAEELHAITDEESVLRLWRKCVGAEARMTNDE